MTTGDDHALASKLAGLSDLADNINTTTAALNEDDEQVTDVLRSRSELMLPGDEDQDDE